MYAAAAAAHNPGMELALIEWLRDRLPPHPRVVLGPGDDAAILRLAAGADCVVTTDMLTDGVDFELSKCDPRRAGRKALAVNLSDLAAMAARPVAATVSLVLPRKGGLVLAKQLIEGMLPLADEFDVAIAGGDTNSWEGRLAVSVTAIGETTGKAMWSRSGARPGDHVIVTGEFGGSIRGKHFDFQPRVREALLLNEKYQVNAAIDVSDGLSLDVWRVARESGCGVALRLDAIPVSADARSLAGDGEESRRRALEDGEDFELVLAVPPAEADRMLSEQPLGVRLTRIGQFVQAPGLWQQDADGEQTPLKPAGWQHELGA